MYASKRKTASAAMVGLFGESTINSTSQPALTSATPAVQYGFAGYALDAVSGDYVTAYRFYDPQMGRWLTQDPIGLAGGINLYEAHRNNPLRFTDPTGLAPGDVFPTLAAAMADAFGYIYTTEYPQGVEYAGFIYQTPGGYTYTNPATIFSPDTSNPGTEPPGALALFHTHPVGAPAGFPDAFSPADIAYANYYGLQSYVGSITGNGLSYNPFTGQQSIYPLNSCPGQGQTHQ